MPIRIRLFVATMITGVASVFVLPLGNAQQATTATPAKRATGPAWAIQQKPVLVQEQHLAFTSETQLYAAEELQAANEAHSLVEKLSKASESERPELKTALREALVRQFDAQQKRRTEEIASIEERLGKLKDTLQKRGAAKDTIVGKRLDQLMGEKDELAWEETRTAPPVSVRQLPNVRYPTSRATEPANTPYAPVPPGVPQFNPLAVPATPVPGVAPQPAAPPAPSALPVPTPPAATPATPAPPAPAAAPTAPVPAPAPAPAAVPAPAAAPAPPRSA